jgi:ubiquinone/menaquinone biosynthesis C-methylase UbiE
MQQQSVPTPEKIFNIFTAYQQSGVLKGAIELDIFTAIGEGNTTVEALAKRCQASPRGIRTLADYLTVMGLLTKNEASYALAPDAVMFLDKRSQAFIGSAIQFLAGSALIDTFKDVASAVRKGGTMLPGAGTVEPENPIWVDFAKAMAPIMFPNAQAMANIAGTTNMKSKVLDIAAGHGIFGIVMATKNPNAHIVALDWPKVLQVAEENARRFNVVDRWSKLPGDALSVDFGTDYDLVLLTNFLHHFSPADCEKILRKVHAALKPTGRLMTLEFVPNDDRVSPPVPAMFSMIMLTGTRSGDAYTFAELDKMMRNAGFSKSELHDLPGLPQNVIVSHA